jgi:phage tail-like protein
MSVTIGSPRNYFRQYAFLLRIPGFRHTGFQDCSGLEVEIEETLLWEGGRALPFKLLTRPKFADIVVSRGACNDDDAVKWFQDGCNFATGLGLTEEFVKRNCALDVLDRDGSVMCSFSILNGFCKKLSLGKFDAKSNEVLIESM